MSLFRIAGFVLAISCLVLALSSNAIAGVVAVEVMQYASGGEATFNNPNSALGTPPSVVFGGAVNPFNPPFGEDHLLRLPPGASVTLRLSQPVAITGQPILGVFSNIGLIDVSPDGSGEAGNPAGTFSPLSVAQMWVSNDNLTFVPVNGGGLIEFDMPTNRWLDSPAWTNYFPQPGTTESNPFIAPPASTLSQGLAAFNGLPYAQMLPLFGGSSGGEWFTLAGLGLSEVQYVRFSVPTGLDPLFNRMILDSVTAVPEPGSVTLLVFAATVLMSRRRVSKVV